jgi:predicted transcriptional regulator
VKRRPGTLSGRIRPTRFGEMLRLYRTVRGLSLRDVAKSSGISSATLMRIEHGETFDVATAFRLWTWMLSAVCSAVIDQ